MAKWQVCTFKRTKNSEWEPGIALVKAFGLSDVATILDSTGKPLSKKGPWDYRLVNNQPLGFLDTEYNS